MAANGDSYCGIYCGACSVFMHGKTGRSDGFVACCGPVPTAEITCSGCKSDKVYAGCGICQFRDCASGKGFEHCVDCAEYPCKAYKRWQSVAKVLPHIRESAASLEAIRHDGVGAWLAAQQKRWACPRCGASFSWYTTACDECGLSLATEAYALAGIRRLVCRWILPATFWKGRARAGAR